MRSPNSGGSSQSSKYRGVRKRKWGKWVSEVRLPNSRQRIWLGSYDSAEKAACAFDAAIFCLRSPRSRGAHLNFPGVVPQISCPRQLTHQQIRAAAARHAHSAPPLPAVEVPTTPVVSETENEETVVSDDWLLSDLAMNDVWYNFMEPTFALDGATDWVEPEVGDSVFGTSSFLWNF